MKSISAFLLAFTGIVSAAAEQDWTAWQWEAPYELQGGLQRIEVPPAVLDVSQPDLGDLRLLSPAGTEIPFLVDAPGPSKGGTRDAAQFKVELVGNTTVIDVDSGAPGRTEGIELISPAQEFLKSVSIEDRESYGGWTPPPVNEVIFRQATGAERLRIPFPVGTRGRLRIIVNDDRTPPIPFTGVRILVTGEKPVTDVLGVVLGAREETPGTTRLTLDLGARNLNVEELRFNVSDAVFSRPCNLDLTTRRTDGGADLEKLGSAVLYRVTGDRGVSVEQVVIPVRRRIADRYVAVTFHNGDSPPLTITGADVRIHPTTLAFFAPQGGMFRLLTGNRGVSPPNYDLNSLRGVLAPASGRQPKPVAMNSKADFQLPPALPGIEATGPAIDLAKWSRQRKVTYDHPGVIGIELDSRVLATCRTDLGDLRLVQNGKQVPYLVRSNKVTRTLKPSQVAEIHDPERPTFSIWKITLPVDGLPVTRLTAKSSAGLFTRRMVARIERQDSNGHRRGPFSSFAEWTRHAADGPADFSLSFGDERAPVQIMLETDNGDNPPVPFDHFMVEFSAPSITAKVADPAPLVLCYGNPEATPPLYDLRLVWSEIMAADQQPASLREEEILGPDKREKMSVDAGSPWLWLALAGVVAALLVVVAKLLPRPATE